MDPDFVGNVKCALFWPDRGLRVYLDLYVPDHPKTSSKYPFGLKYLLVTNTPFWRIFWFKDHSNHVPPIFAKQNT